jgi:hypothetical protein
MKSLKFIATLFALVLLGCGQQKPSSESWNERASGSQQNSRSQERHRESNPSESGTNQQNSADRYDLSRDEERGGHTLRKHVGRSDDELRERLDRERISASSTWTDRESAETTVAHAMQAERGRIESWEQRGEPRPNLALHFDAGHPIGRTMTRGSSQSMPCSQAVIVLKADGNSFYVLTTYPEERE